MKTKMIQNKKFLRFLLILFAIISVFFIVFSYVLIDPNLTLTRTDWWEAFRNWAVQIGYHNTPLSSVLYLVFITLFFIFHFFFIKAYKKINLLHILVPISLLTIFSYPFLSHDLFNYMFDAKIVTVYHQNPYLYRALDFPKDEWIRFMHWTHRTYPYGPTFLPLTLIPSFLSFGKFLPSFILFKGLFLTFFLISVHLLNKLNKKWAIIYATHPLIIIEGLVNAHLDYIALSLGIIGIHCLFKNKNIFSRILFLLSGGIKYTTLPLVFLSKDNKSKLNVIVFAIIIAIGAYISYTLEIQPWYFLAIFIFLPFYEKFIGNLNIFFVGLLVSYYPYMKYAGWTETKSIFNKHSIIYLFFSINIIYFVAKYLLSKVKPVR